jgi:predicted RNA-binding protein YlqC (UPF0109 family)
VNVVRSTIRAAPADTGGVIGKGGAVTNAIRKIAKAIAGKNEVIGFVDENRARHRIRNRGSHRWRTD